jgi:CrcB protein
MTQMLQHCLIVAAAGAVGAVARFLVATACLRWFGAGFPVGTLLVNVIGSLLLGWFLASFDQQVFAISEGTRLAVAVGFCGAFTTYSTFAYETESLWHGGAPWRATANVILSLTLGLFAVRLGIWLAGTR